MTYHTVIFLDYYLTIPAKNFNPDLPYTIVDIDKLPEGAVDDVIPNQFYTKQDFISYLAAIKKKCKSLIMDTPPEQFGQVWIDISDTELHGLCPNIVIKYTLLEILFYNFRHIQHHIGQLNLLLRQKANRAVDWILVIDEHSTEIIYKPEKVNDNDSNAMTPHDIDELEEAKVAITSIINKCENASHKFSDNSPKKTLLNKRIRAFKISHYLIDKTISDLMNDQNK